MMEFENFIKATCGLGESVLDTCLQNEITSIDLLNAVTENDQEFKELIPCLGTRVQIRMKLKQILEQICTTLSENIEIPLDDNCLSTSSTHVSSIGSNEIDEPPKKFIILENIPLTQDCLTSHPEQSSESKSLDLPNLLDKSIIGKAILSIYQIHKQLDSRCQSYLSDIIVQHFINVVPFRRLQNADFAEFSKEIVKCFPNEAAQVYYTPPINKRLSKNNKSVIARGKLLDKYRNKLSFLRKAGALPRLVEDEVTEDSTLHDDIQNDCNEDVNWLQNNQDPWTEVQNKWTNTFHYRQALLKKDVEVSDVLDEFPVISNPLGHTLIDLDFKTRFPEYHQKLFLNFEPVFNKLLELRRKNLTPADHFILEIIEGNVNKESRHFLMLNLLISLLPTKSYNKKTKANWHPTANDSKEGLIVQVKIPGDIENVIERRRNTLKKYNLPMLPFIIVEAPSYTEIKNIYVSFDKILYKLISIIKALDVCFQLIHVLNLVYPFESEHIWMFIQLSIYNYKTKFDNIPNIIDIANKVSMKEN